MTTESEMLEELKKIEMSEGKFLFFTRMNLIFIIRTKIKSSDKKIKKKIQFLEDLFINKFEKELKEFNGDVSSFQLFEKDLEAIFNEMTKVEK